MVADGAPIHTVMHFPKHDDDLECPPSSVTHNDSDTIPLSVISPLHMPSL